MIYNIIGCGDSAKQWDGTGNSIGVNDAEKCGHPVQNLVIVNAPSSFSEEQDRLDIMKATKATVWTNLLDEWHNVLKTQDINEFEEESFRPVGSKIVEGEVYFSQTSPLVAMSLAYNLMAMYGKEEKAIHLYGVDFTTHPKYKQGQAGFDAEVQRYLQFRYALQKKNVEVKVTAASYLSKFMDTI